MIPSASITNEAYTGDTIRLVDDTPVTVLYGIPTYTQFDHCRQAVEGIINNSSLVPNKIVIVDNSEVGLAYETLYDLTEKYPQVSILIRSENILSGAWNDLMQIESDYTIIANDDVFPHYHSIEALVNAARNNPEVAMWNGSGHSGNSYSYYLLQHWAYNKLSEFNRIHNLGTGGFNEQFRPAYFEDNCADYILRILLGLVRNEVPEATFEHIGSATMRNMNDERIVTHHKRFAENQRLYQHMWGGLPGKERFQIPFERPYQLDLSDL